MDCYRHYAAWYGIGKNFNQQQTGAIGNSGVCGGASSCVAVHSWAGSSSQLCHYTAAAAESAGSAAVSHATDRDKATVPVRCYGWNSNLRAPTTYYPNGSHSLICSQGGRSQCARQLPAAWHRVLDARSMEVRAGRHDAQAGVLLHPKGLETEVEEAEKEGGCGGTTSRS